MKRTVRTNRNAAQGRRRSKGQSVVEMAMTLPLLVLLFAIVIDGGLGINSWLRVNTAARDGTRFALDAGRNPDIRDLVLSKLNGLDTNKVDIYIIRGKTDDNGCITGPGCSGVWSVDAHYGPGSNLPKLQATTIRQRLVVSGSPNADDNVQFTIVEVDYSYATLLGSFVKQPTLPMTSYAIIQQYSQ